jgi:hypothetical protein
MVISVQRYMDVNTDKWVSIPAIGDIKVGIDEHILQIRPKLKAGGKSSKGVTKDKTELHAILAIKTGILSGAIVSFATKSNNNDLKINGKLTKAVVKNLRDIEVPERITIVTDLAKAHLADLAAYGVTEAQITDLETSVDDFRELIGEPRLVISHSNLGNKSAKELVASVMDLLNQELDNVMLQFELSDPEFYEGYRKARVIVD